MREREVSIPEKRGHAEEESKHILDSFEREPMQNQELVAGYQLPLDDETFRNSFKDFDSNQQSFKSTNKFIKKDEESLYNPFATRVKRSNSQIEPG